MMDQVKAAILLLKNGIGFEEGETKYEPVNDFIRISHKSQSVEISFDRAEEIIGHLFERMN